MQAVRLVDARATRRTHAKQGGSTVALVSGVPSRRVQQTFVQSNRNHTWFNRYPRQGRLTT